MRRLALALLLLAAAPAAADGTFFTNDELARIDEALALLNMTRADAGFDKLVIDDPWRLSVVNRTLSKPLEAPDVAWGWAGLAEKSPAVILAHAATDLDLLLPAYERVSGPVAEFAATLVAEAFSGLTAEERDRLAAWGYAALVEAEGHDGLFPKPPPEEDPRPMLEFAKSVDRAKLLSAALALLQSIDDLAARTESEGDWLVVAGPGDDIHDLRLNPPMVLVDLGGDDTYFGAASARPGRPVSIVIDLGGDDVYGDGESVSGGAGFMGIGILVDKGDGNDRYFGGHCSQGAGVFGVGILIDEGGNDLYECRDTGQGAGAFGVGLLLDLGAGNDRFHADLFGQGFAYTAGFGLLRNEKGNDVYDAGGVHLHYPLYNDRFQSLSQGFSIGIRPHASGGVAMLVDDEGNDRYSADIYGQGSSYWFSYGGLVDRGGNDTYVLGHYGQGAGIHLSVGCLLDLAGQDLYYDFSGVGIGGAHDFAVGVLVDREGDDYYAGSGGSQGGALTNSFALLLDGGGDDGYSAVRIGATLGGGAAARGMGSIGLFLDLAGKDLHGSPYREGTSWTKEEYGAGIDLPAPPPPAAPPPAPKRLPPGEAEARVRKEAWDEAKGAFDPAKLWALCCQWPVGEMSEIVPAARVRFAELGEEALAKALLAVGTFDGLELLAVQEIVKKAGLSAAPALREMLTDEAILRRAQAAGLLADIGDKDALPAIVALLADRDVGRAALDAIARLGARAHWTEVAALLDSPVERTRVAAARCLEALKATEAIPALAAKMRTGEMFTVRFACEDVLVSFGEAAAPALREIALGSPDLMAKRHGIRALGRMADAFSLFLLRDLLAHEDWRVRYEAAGALGACAAKDPLSAPVASQALLDRAAVEENPHVKSRIAVLLR
jgi:HEAT repeat protein